MNTFGVVTFWLYVVWVVAAANGQDAPIQDDDPMFIIDGTDDRAVQSTEFLEIVELNTTNTAVVKTYLFINNQKMSWMEAAYFCSIYDFELLSVETKLEHDVITKHLVAEGDSQVQFWTSGNKIGRSGYLWLNNKFMNYNRWGVGEPNVPAVNCMILYNGFWYDAPCEGNFNLICEKYTV